MAVGIVCSPQTQAATKVYIASSFDLGELGFLVSCWTGETSSLLTEDFVPDLY